MNISEEELFERMLKAAVIERCEKEIETYPPEEEILKTEISKKAARKARRTMNWFYLRSILSSGYKVGKRRATIAISTIVIAVGIFFLQSKEAEGSILTFIIEVCKEYLGFNKYYGDSFSEQEYEPGYLPKGYSKFSENETEYYLRKTYKNQDGESIVITVIPIGANTHNTDNEDYEISDCDINGFYGRVFINKLGGENKLIWSTTDAEIFIRAPLSKKELIKIAKKFK